MRSNLLFGFAAGLLTAAVIAAPNGSEPKAAPAAAASETCVLVVTRPPRILGHPKVGRTLHATHGTWRCAP